jgi:hypothetical protein
MNAMQQNSEDYKSMSLENKINYLAQITSTAGQQQVHTRTCLEIADDISNKLVASRDNTLGARFLEIVLDPNRSNYFNAGYHVPIAKLLSRDTGNLANFLNELFNNRKLDSGNLNNFLR